MLGKLVFKHCRCVVLHQHGWLWLSTPTATRTGGREGRAGRGPELSPSILAIDFSVAFSERGD